MNRRVRNGGGNGLRLEKRRGRFDGSDVQVRYRFVLVDQEALPLDAVQ